MKILKKKFKKILIKKKFNKIPGGDKLKYEPSTEIIVNKEGIVTKPSNTTYKAPLKPIKIKKKLGRWCEYYEGRLPFPIECSNNKAMPKSYLFKGSEKILVRDTSNCLKCNRNPSFISWKRGDWYRVIESIKKGDDLTDMDPPMRGE
jgi:hypothetical protein